VVKVASGGCGVISWLDVEGGREGSSMTGTKAKGRASSGVASGGKVEVAGAKERASWAKGACLSSRVKFRSDKISHNNPPRTIKLAINNSKITNHQSQAKRECGELVIVGIFDF
jgi:hypothetical protein